MYYVCPAIRRVTVIEETINEIFKVAETELRRECIIEQALILQLQL